MGIMTFDRRADGGGAGAKQRADGINWSYGSMRFRARGGMLGAFMCAFG